MTSPNLGDTKHILDLSTCNAKYYRTERFKQVIITDPDNLADAFLNGTGTHIKQ